MEYRWIEPQIIEENKLNQYEDIPRAAGIILFTRGIRGKSEVQSYFTPTEDDIADPLSLFDIQTAVARIEKAIVSHEKIFIHGDFDADGLCATGLLWEYLYKQRKADVLPYIPSRVDEGYGMSEKSLETILEQGGSLVISVDCGVRDSKLISDYIQQSRKSPQKSSVKGKTAPSRIKKSLDFIITDHHQLGDPLPSSVPFVHPLHPGGMYSNPYLSGAGVAWKLVAAIEKLRSPKRFHLSQIQGLDLAAFSTICDLMPLSGENRAIVSLGLQMMSTSPRCGIRALMNESGIHAKALNAYDIGYILGPRINAAGRIGDPMDALRLFTTEKDAVARALASTLGLLNRKRQQKTDELLAEVREQIEREGKGEHLYFAYGNDWNEGIIGLVAGKLQELYHRPVVLVTKGKEGARGSARSINGFNIVEAIGKFENLLVKHGGHALAAGFTIDPENIEELGILLKEHAQEFLTEEMMAKELRADVRVDAGELDWALMKVLQKMEPFGYGNRKPVFWVSDSVVVESKKMGDGSHLKIMVKGDTGDVLECVFFGGGTKHGNIEPGSVVDMMGNLEVNEWNGNERLQLRIIDLKTK